MLDELAEMIGAMEERERLEYLIVLGKELKESDGEKIPGCVSNVYLDVKFKGGKFEITGKADSLIVKGYVKLIIEAFNGKTCDEILKANVEEFIKKAKLNVSVIPSRANAFGNIYSFVKKQAKKYCD